MPVILATVIAGLMVWPDWILVFGLSRRTLLKFTLSLNGMLAPESYMSFPLDALIHDAKFAADDGLALAGEVIGEAEARAEGSRRPISSRTVVGEAGVPWNWAPLVGAGKIPAVNKACAFGSRRLVGIVLLGNGAPSTKPSEANLACCAGESWAAVGTLMVVVPKLPP